MQWKAYHESVPRHGRKKTIEQNTETQLINNPVITVTVYNCLVKVKNHYNFSHCSNKVSVEDKNDNLPEAQISFFKNQILIGCLQLLSKLCLAWIQSWKLKGIYRERKA